VTRRQVLALLGVVAVLVVQAVIVVIAVIAQQPGLILLCFIVLVIVWVAIKPKRPGPG
jgi:hypothetical protein